MISLLSVFLTLALNPSAEAACKKSQYCAYQNKVGGDGACPQWACRDKDEQDEVPGEKQASLDAMKSALEKGNRDIASVKKK